MKSLKSMSKKERKVVLISVSNEVQDLCEFEPAIKTDGKSEKELIAKLTEASEDLRFEDKKSKAGKVLEPADELSEEAISTFEFLGLIKPASEEKEEAPKKGKAKMKVVKGKESEEENGSEENEDEWEDVLAAEVENSSKLKELKEIAKDNTEFGNLKNQLSGYSSVKSLKSYMLKILSGEIEAPVAKKVAAKKTSTAKKSTSTKKEKNTSSNKNVINRQEAVLKTIKKKCGKFLNMNEIASFSNDLYIEKNPEVKGVSKIQNMMNVVRHSVLALVEFDVLKEFDSKYKLNG